MPFVITRLGVHFEFVITLLCVRFSVFGLFVEAINYKKKKLHKVLQL